MDFECCMAKGLSLDCAYLQVVKYWSRSWCRDLSGIFPLLLMMTCLGLNNRGLLCIFAFREVVFIFRIWRSTEAYRSSWWKLPVAWFWLIYPLHFYDTFRWFDWPKVPYNFSSSLRSFFFPVPATYRFFSSQLQLHSKLISIFKRLFRETDLCTALYCYFDYSEAFDST